MFDQSQLREIQVTLLNVFPQDRIPENFRSEVGDARAMEAHSTDDFDVVFSNSVIGHVGSFHNQKLMANEIRRIGKRYFVQASSAPRFPWTHIWGILPPALMEVFMAKSKTERGRFSSRKKMDVVLRVLRGDDLDLVSREAGVTAATVSAWRDQFVASGQVGLKSRADDGRDDELARLKALVGDLTMRLELSREAVQRLRGGTPLVTGRSTR